MPGGPTCLKLLLEARRWTYLRLRREYEAAARDLGLGNLTIGPRQLVRWREGGLVGLPRPESCMILERLFGEPAVALLASGDEPDTRSGPAALTVAISLVTHQGRVLLVRRRRPEGVLDWQFPAGIIKPCEDPIQVAAAEVASETGITVKVRERVGSRVHPVTGVQCEYFLCEYLHGAPTNLDPQENAEVTWVPLASLDRYIDPAIVYPPARDALVDDRTPE